MEPDPRFLFSDPKETIRTLQARQERRRLNASSVSSSPCPEPSCEQRDPLISGEKVRSKKLRALKPISRTSQQFAPNSASSRLQVTTHFLHASLLSLRSRASLLSAEPRLASLAPEPRLASLAAGWGSRLGRVSSRFSRGTASRSSCSGASPRFPRHASFRSRVAPNSA